RRTTNSFDRRGLSFQSTTFGKLSGQQLANASGRFDPAQNQWIIRREALLRPGITNRTETEFRSPFGKLIATRSGNSLEVRPVYDVNGVPKTNQFAFLNSTSGRIDGVARLESEFSWQEE